MRKYTVLILLLFTAPVTWSQNIFSTLHLNEETDYKTKPPKKIIQVNTFYNSSGEEIDTSIKTFDNAGMLLREERHGNNGKINLTDDYINDTTRHLVLVIKSLDKSWGQSIDYTYFTYDANNFLTRVEHKDQNGTTSIRSEIINNEKGNPIEMTTYDGNGQSFGKETGKYLYDKNQVVTSVISNNGKTLSTDSIKISFKNSTIINSDELYNEKGDLEQYSTKNYGGSKTLYKEEYQYDTFGNCTEEKIYKVTLRSNGKQKLKLDRDFRKQYFY